MTYRRRRESKVERNCVATARAHGCVVSKLTDPTGIMDHVFWVPLTLGGPFLLEFKDPNGKTDKNREALQAYYRKALGNDGYSTGIVTTEHEFMACCGKALEAMAISRTRSKIHADGSAVRPITGSWSRQDKHRPGGDKGATRKKVDKTKSRSRAAPRNL